MKSGKLLKQGTTLTFIILSLFLHSRMLILSANNDLIIFHKDISQGIVISDPFNQMIDSSQYVERFPITILSDNEFRQEAETEGWPGNGSHSNPIIISNLSIIGEDRYGILIFIKETSVHFRIENCILTGGERGIELWRSYNGVITNNTIYDNHIGILAKGQNIGIFQNLLFQNGRAIIASDSYNIDCRHNTIYDNSGTGINYGNNEESSISFNTIFNNAAGINLDFNKQAIDVSNNTIFNNSHGILVYASNGTSIRYNVIYNNYNYGIRVTVSKDFNISRNDLIGNNLNMDLYLGTADLHTMTIEYNYWWPEWTSPDDNKDGFIDQPIEIPLNKKEGELIDPYPLAQPNFLPLPHVLTKPLIISPRGSVFINTTVKVEWIASQDTEGHTIFYQLYYSIEVNRTWQLIVSELTNTSFYWNTTNMNISSRFIENEQYLNCELLVIATCEGNLTASGTSTFNEIVSSTSHTNPGWIPIFSLFSLIGVIILRKWQKKSVRNRY